MGVVVARTKKARVPGAERRTVTDVTFDNSYAEGGEPLTAEQLGLNSVDVAVCSLIHGSESTELLAGAAWYSGGKLHLLDVKTGKEVASTKDMSKVVVQVVAFGH
jgi:hypothetical protein